LKICPDCLSEYKKSKAGIFARKQGGAWGKGKWIDSVYHNENTRKCQNHHSQALADSVARRAGLNNATPSWANRLEIKKIYLQCCLKTKITGIKHEVDHIVPLKGANICGLHVHWNLRVIEASANRLKGNKF
jgi:5-methylcytosine-specific restriction endonuclease McrA